MNIQKVINQLKKQYPGKKIIKNNPKKPTEIICEIDPTTNHPDYSVAIAVIDKSTSHYHKFLTEEYEILKGKLILVKEGKKYVLKESEKHTIKPGTLHFAVGKETWVRVTAKPGWTKKDHILFDKNFSLIKRPEMEMIELMDKNFDVRVYFSNPPPDLQLLDKKAGF
jgi:hypothetical protein